MQTVKQIGILPRLTLERELLRLQDDVLAMGNRVAGTIVESVHLLKARDFEASRRLIAQDLEINALRYTIEADCLTLIATQQPIAGDLRVTAAMLDIVTELERISDYSKGNAKVNLLLDSRPLRMPLADLPLMAQKAQSMLYRALIAFARRDVALARAIPGEDDEVDAMYKQVYRDLLTHMIANPQNLDSANCLLWVAHNLERTADRVTNICERVVFTVTGEIVELNSELESPPLLTRPRSG